MANTISYPVKYLNMLDRIYKEVSVTSILDANPDAVRFSAENEQTVYLKKMILQGLGNYSKSTGYDDGDINVTWEAHTISIDRSKRFKIDTLDEKQAYITAPEIGAEFERTCVAPEIDAYRFSKICTLKAPALAANLTASNVIAAIRAGQKALNDAEVPKDNRILYVSTAVYQYLQDAGAFNKQLYVQNNNGVIDTNIDVFDKMIVKEVPSSRFYSNIDLATTGAGGFSAGNSAKALNFMIVHSPSVCGVIRHIAPKIIPPANNGEFDGYLYCYRIYHDLFIPDNKLNGVYTHTVA